MQKTESELHKRYGLRWDVLKGSHHKYLDPSRQWITDNHWMFPAISLWHNPVLDLAKIIGPTEDIVREMLGIAGFPFSAFARKFPHALFLMINPCYPVQRIRKEVERLVADKYARLTDSEKNLYQDWHYTRLPSLHVWRDYFKCYDQAAAKGLAHPDYGKVSHMVYGKGSKPQRARTGINRVQRLIQQAETNAWPPSRSTLL